MTKELNIQRL